MCVCVCDKVFSSSNFKIIVLLDEEISSAICRSFSARKHVLPWRSRFVSLNIFESEFHKL